MLILNINGAINSGKTTVSKALVKILPNSFFIEVDSLMSNAERNILKLTREEGWTEKLKRFDVKIDGLRTSGLYKTVIFAFPITKKYYDRWKLWSDTNHSFKNITLAPTLDVCLSNRGRNITEMEIDRIKEMYKNGVDNPSFSDLIIDNGNQTPEETAQIIKKFIDNGCKIINKK